MRTARICSFLFAFFLIFSSIHAQSDFVSTANLSTTWTNHESSIPSINYTDGSRIRVILNNSGGIPCGFFCNGTCTSYIFAILINRYYMDSPAVIWSANRDNPVREGAILNLTASGELVLQDVNGTIVWTTNTTGKSIAGMNLTDNGNLVLFDGDDLAVWQSFHHPTHWAHRLFDGQKLITTWTNEESSIRSTKNDGSSIRVILEENRFSCGFFCNGDCTSYLFAILVNPYDPVVIWSANRDNPVSNGAMLNFTAAGELVLQDVNGTIVWTTNTTGKSIAGMNLTDNGNLVLFDGDDLAVWQSFHHPTHWAHRLFDGQKLITTWTNEESSIRSTKNDGSSIRVILEENRFSCGFFCNGDCTSYLFAILVNPYDPVVIWSANRDNPVSNGAMLNFTAAGELVLQDVNGTIVWTTNTTGKSIAGMNLTDNGNLVLFDGDDLAVWQSFHHPTHWAHRLFDGQKLITTWTNEESSIRSTKNDGSSIRVILEENRFSCGFFCNGDCTSYLFAILVNPYDPVVIWSANRDNPVSNGAMLNFTAAGELVLQDVNGTIVWTTNTTGKSIAGMNLTDNGNLVLFDGDDLAVWQSFHHPTHWAHRLFDGQKLITTWTNEESSIRSTKNDGSSIRVILEENRFSCGFFCNGDCTSYLFAILVNPYDPVVIWSANRDNPVSNGAMLNFTAAGELVLQDVNGTIVWTTNTTGKSIAGMNLTDNGNLVLFDGDDLAVWQSFHHPTHWAHRLFDGQKLITTWTNEESSIRSTKNDGSSIRVILEENRFSCGFFCNGDCTSYLFAILVNPYDPVVIWSANRDNPVSNGAMLNFTAAGELVLQDVNGTIVWTTNTTGKSIAGMNLTDNGNLVLFDGDDLAVWQSFHHPTHWAHRLFDGQKLITTWTNEESSIRSTKNDGSSIRVILEENRFSCGFFCNGDCTSYLFAILVNPYDPVVIWSANRDNPVSNGAMLNFTAAGELVLQDVDGTTVWTTNTTGKSTAGMTITEGGNLVLFDTHNSIVWQSFDHPTDCLVRGQKLFQGQKLIPSVSSTNWTAQKDLYSLQVAEKGLFAYVGSNSPQLYYRYLVQERDTNNTSYLQLLGRSLCFFFFATDRPRYCASVIEISTDYTLLYIKLMPDGHLKVFGWEFLRTWTTVADVLTGDLGECSYPLVCGRNAICSGNQQCGCPARDSFRAVNDLLPNMGCSHVTPLTCDATQDQSFIVLEDVTYITYSADMEDVDMESCKKACINKCSCKAALFKYGFNSSSGNCYLPSELFTVTRVDAGVLPYNASTFIKVQNVRSKNQVARIVGSAIGSFALLLILVVGFTKLILQKKKKDREMEEEQLDQVTGMPTRFSYQELKTATDNFSKKLGEGGFGTVFQGTLEDGSQIAVKCLQGLVHVKKSFLAEVESIGSIHHVNLVRLRGFCAWKSQRFLVYEFMSNGSLDEWIYNGDRKHLLGWECRKIIILNIAKGLAYLHEECRQKIIHLDIKPQNILLDKDFNAKVADFGLSKLIDRNQSHQEMSTMRGTPGYLAPEWLGSIITEKVDVYSFGIVLLEILCGRKNFDTSQPEESQHLLGVFQRCWEQGTLLNIVDRYSEDMQVHGTEVVEMMKLASWCLQSDFTRRPSMSSVVKALEGGMNVESNLDYNFLYPKLQKITDEHQKSSKQALPSILSGPR